MNVVPFCAGIVFTLLGLFIELAPGSAANISGANRLSAGSRKSRMRVAGGFFLLIGIGMIVLSIFA